MCHLGASCRCSSLSKWRRFTNIYNKLRYGRYSEIKSEQCPSTPRMGWCTTKYSRMSHTGNLNSRGESIRKRHNSNWSFLIFFQIVDWLTVWTVATERNSCRIRCIWRGASATSKYRIMVCWKTIFSGHKQLTNKKIHIYINPMFHPHSNSNAVLTRAIENVELPLNSTDPDLLLLKAISAASTHCLFQCMNLLQRHHDVSGDNRPDTAA